jgi:hypothetical protein
MGKQQQVIGAYLVLKWHRQLIQWHKKLPYHHALQALFVSSASSQQAT